MRFLIGLALAISVAAPAAAYTPHVGDRAADIHGRNVITDSVAHLEDYAGQWVFIDFWASWCGPCMGELPNMLAQTRPWRDSGKLALFSVSLDQASTDLKLNNVIDEFGIDYPVVYDGNGWKTVQSVEWGIHSIPATFLLDPQQNIVATNLRGAALGPALEFFLGSDETYVPIGVRSSNTVNDDGSVDVQLELASPDHKALAVKVDYWHTRYTYAEDDPNHEGRPTGREYIEQNEDDAEMEMNVTAGEFGDSTVRFTIPAVENTQRLDFTIMVQLPGTEGLMDGEGLWVTDRNSVKFES